MSLISVQRSPSPIDELTAANDSDCESEGQRTAASSGQKSRTLSECFFTVRGAAVILPHHSTTANASGMPTSVAVRCCSSSSRTTAATEGGQDSIHAHLRVMLNALRPEDSVTMVVRLQSPLPSAVGDCGAPCPWSSSHVRYLAVLSTQLDATESREAALLGFHFIGGPSTSNAAARSAIGVAVPISTSSTICLDGDGGVRVEEDKQPNCCFKLLFKPVSIQSMWSLYQCLHKEQNVVSEHCKLSHFSGHRWLDYYKGQVVDDDALCGLWHFVEAEEGATTDDDAAFELRPTRPPASLADTLRKDTQQLETEAHIKRALKEIMQSVDLDNVTSQDIRRRLSEQMAVELRRYKEFIDHQMLVILGQLDKPSQIFDYLYLGTEWNASNWEELKANGVEYILNVTKEVDNFFPSQFKYLKIWVSDEATTELLMHWHRTYDFVKEAKEKGAKVLVHCKKGISRSASTVVAYAMKEYAWALDAALEHVKRKRDCITPNPGFMEQLGTFHGMLQASNNRHSAVFNLPRGAQRLSVRSGGSAGGGSLTAGEATADEGGGGEETVEHKDQQPFSSQQIAPAVALQLQQQLIVTAAVVASPPTKTCSKMPRAAAWTTPAATTTKSARKGSNNDAMTTTTKQQHHHKLSAQLAANNARHQHAAPQGTRRSSFPSAEGGHHGFAHSRLCWNGGRVRQRRECFEQQMRRQSTKTTATSTKQFVSNIAKKIGHLSLYGRFGGGTNEQKPLRRDGGGGMATPASVCGTVDATTTAAAAAMSTSVRSLVIAFEQRK